MTDAAATVKRIRELFDIVMDQPPESRRDFLYAASVNDSPHVRSEVEALIEGELSTDAFSLFQHDRSTETFAGPIGQRLGAYEVVREIGDGGMGENRPHDTAGREQKMQAEWRKWMLKRKGARYWTWDSP